MLAMFLNTPPFSLGKERLIHTHFYTLVLSLSVYSIEYTDKEF